MKEFINNLMKKPAVSHLMAAIERFGNRLGSQFASAITYFSVLALVPIIMFAFAMLGMTLTVLRPDLFDTVKTEITSLVGSDDFGKKIGDLITGFLEGWRGIGVVALLLALYAGSNWIGNLRSAIRSQWRDEWPELPKKTNFFLTVLSNIVIFLGMLVLILVGVALAIFATSLNEQVFAWLGLAEAPVTRLFLRILAPLLNLVVSWLLVMFLFLTLPGERAGKRDFLIGTFGAALGITVLQQLAGFITGFFANNRGAALFGPVIIVMLFLNLLATIIMFAASWIGTADLDEKQKARTRPVGPVVIALSSRTGPVRKLPKGEFKAVRPSTDHEQVVVPQAVAVKSVQAGMTAGYGVGAATGIGLGALVASVLKRRGRRTKK